MRRRFGQGKEWGQKVTILIDEAAPQEILRCLEEQDSKRFDENRGILRPDIPPTKAKLTALAAIGAIIWTNWDKIRGGLGTAREWFAEKFEDRPVMMGAAVVGTATVISIAGFSLMWGHSKGPVADRRDPSSVVQSTPGASQPGSAEIRRPFGAGPGEAAGPVPTVASVDLAASVPPQPAAAWTNAVPIAGIKKLRRIWGSSSRNLWAVGDPGVILHYDGQSWARVPGAVAGDLPGLFVTGSEVWAAGDSGILHHDGKVWAYELLPGTPVLRALWGSGPDDLWAVGKAGAIIHRQEPGWSAAVPVTDNSLVTIWGSGPADVWVVGLRGTLVNPD